MIYEGQINIIFDWFKCNNDELYKYKVDTHI